ncbi:uncharacterized protein LOC122274476 [Carya illinoinensis]|uniref:uncharacterized protein LOC122274476 n=1 Tax=Carya illinoinensis TaxID=32201 RepID=UPI001C720C11|nr:uncharacterized protein LOC122274476 [Carya illinoinensis]
MNPLGSPGPDGFPTLFFQKYWDIVGNCVSKASLEVLNGGKWDNTLNETLIALIPKKLNPSIVTDFRPISLCNVLYKIIAKTLANRLNKILPSIISPTQTAFVLGRLITDNIIVAFESLHTMKARLKEREGYMTLKLDMSKAYDRIEWDFLKSVMKKMGFLATCIELVIKANSIEWSQLYSLLECYERAFGQRLNNDKTSIFFSSNTREQTKDIVTNIAGIRGTNSYEKYLGLPALVGRSRSQSFQGILDKVQAKLNSWKTKLLSQAGKETPFQPTAWEFSSCLDNYLMNLTNKSAPSLNAHLNWEAPPQGKLKVNWDAGLDKTNCKVGVRAVVRDWEGKILATLRMNHPLFLDPLPAKAYAAFQASLFLKSLGWQDVIMEGDSLQVVNCLKSLTDIDSYAGLLIKATKK